MVVQFFLGRYTFLPLSELTQIRPTVVWVSLSALLSVLWAIVHARRARPKVEHARKVNADMLYAYSRKRDAERQLGQGKG